jgi:cellulose synthase (UDP-forming)
MNSLSTMKQENSKNNSLIDNLSSQLSIINWSNPLIRIVILGISSILLYIVISFPLDYKMQFIFGVAFIILSSYISKKFDNRFAVLLIIFMSFIMTMRYFYWRFTTTLEFESSLEAVLGYLLLSAELYGLVIMLLGYFQNSWPYKRESVPLPSDENLWPHVDIFVPTYNEPLSIVKITIIAAKLIDWPEDKLHIYLLDDGNRPEFKKFASELGVNYIARKDNRHAKAGNLNNALKESKSEFVAIFDCDHIPCRSFLQMTMGLFFKDNKLAIVQTPHYFFSPDPIERNLKVHREVPNEGELFYGIVQEGNDLWNASFFCGSCAVLKREPLEEVGGVAVETVTEDAHTALKISRLGYNLSYLAIPLAAGLATDSLFAHVNQRIRWARGMAQIFRIDNPFFGKGLKFGQRICYSTAMVGFFYGVPRVLFLLAPLAYLLAGLQIYQAFALTVFSFAIPHVVMSQIAGHKVQAQFRHSFWGEIYDTLLSPYVLLPVLVALINPKLGSFNVTKKGGQTSANDYFDLRIATPIIILLGLNIFGLFYGTIHKIVLENGDVYTSLLNLVWVVFNIIILGACVFVALEARELRSTPRVQMTLPAAIYLPNGKTIFCSTTNFSSNGFGLLLPEGCNIPAGSTLSVGIFRGKEESIITAKVKKGGNELGLEIEKISQEDLIKLVNVTFSRADNWAKDWGNNRRASPLASLKELMGHGVVSPKKLLNLRNLNKI